MTTTLIPNPDALITEAEKFLNYTESPPNTNENQFGAWYGFNGVAWCAIYVSYCFYMIGLPLPIKTPKGFSACQQLLDYAKAHGMIVPKSEAQKGDLLLWQFDKDPQPDHVDIFKQWQTVGSIAVTIGGNTTAADAGSESNGGEVVEKTRNMVECMAIVRPPWAQPAIIVPPVVIPAKPTPPVPSGVVAPAFRGRQFVLASPYLKGDDVRQWQQEMFNRGWHTVNGKAFTVDGVYGPQSEKLCEMFQTEKGLRVDGVVGPITWNATWEAKIT